MLSRSTIRAVLAILMSAIFPLALAAAPPAHADPRDPASPDEEVLAPPEQEEVLPTGPEIQVREMTPEILVSEETLHLTVDVSGLEDEDAGNIRLLVSAQADPFDTPAEVDAFLNDGRNDGWAATEYYLSDTEVAAAAAPQGTSIALDIPVVDLPLWNEEAWGPYGVIVRLLGTRDQAETGNVAQAQTLLLWFPPGSAGTSNVSVLVTGAANVAAEQWMGAVQQGASVALSPSQMRPLLRGDAGEGAEVVAAPEADASLSLLASTGQHALYALAERSRLGAQADDPGEARGNGASTTEPAATGQQSYDGTEAQDTTDAPTLGEALQEAGVHVISDVLVADEGWMDLQTVRKAGGQAVLSPSSGVMELIPGGYTPSSRYVIDTRTGATVLDTSVQPGASENVTTVLDSWAAGAAALDDHSRQRLGLNALTARQRVRSFTSMATQEDPGDVLNLWINVSAQGLGPDSGVRLAELFDVPWVNRVSLQDVLGSPPSQVQRQPLHDFQTEEQSEVRQQLAPVDAEVTLAQAIAQAAAQDYALQRSALNAALSATAAGIGTEERQERADAALVELRTITDVISIIPSSKINVMGKSVPFPVTVSNAGSVPLNLLIGLEASDPRLISQGWATALVPAGGSVTVHLPVEAVGAGQVGARVVAKTEGGVMLDVSPEITVNVRANWEDTGTWVVGGILITLFTFGLIRSFRKGRRRMDVAE